MTTDLPVYQFSYNPGFGKNAPQEPIQQAVVRGRKIHAVGTP